MECGICINSWKSEFPFALAKYQYQLILADIGIQLMRFTYVSGQCLLVVPIFPLV